jgi:Extensin-like protein C-terminus
MRRPLLVISFAALATAPAPASPQSTDVSSPMTEATVNGALPSHSEEEAAPPIVKAEILLGRAHISPGEIDDQDGDNYRGALRAFGDTAKLDAAKSGALTRIQGEPSLKFYGISAVDVAAANNVGTPSKPPVLGGGNGRPLVSTSSMSPSEFGQCISDLTAKKIAFDQVGDIKEEGCQLSGAIRLAVVPTPFGDVAISGRPAMLCDFGRQFSTWVRDVAAPMTLAYTGKRLSQIESGSAFSCRARYDKPGAVPSEHAKGDAIDIAAFVLDGGRRLRVKGQESDTERDLVRALRTTACGYFTTVLGPGSDAAHAEHFHFDTGLHGVTPNYRICE